MRKRIRKKKLLSEFQQFGCSIKIDIDPSADYEAFADDFINNAIEKNNMQFGGIGEDGIVQLGGRDVYLDNLKVLQQWLDRNPTVVRWELSPPKDLNNI